MYNVKQITNFDLKNAVSVNKNVIIGGETYRNVQYKIISQTYLKNNINKFGYCCEPKAIPYPIFLTINGIEKEFQIGKTGMFELQPDTWQNINDDSSIEQEINVIVTEIKVPWRFNEPNDENYQGYNFKLDFIYNVN